MFIEVSRSIQTCVLTIDLKSTLDNSKIRIIGVHGPSIEANRSIFFTELMNFRPAMDIPWMVYGDFNQTMQASD
jgi:hypothetical protein